MLKKFLRTSLILAGILAICITVTSPASYAITLQVDNSHENTITQSSETVKYVSETEDQLFYTDIPEVKRLKTDEERKRDALLIVGAIAVGIIVIVLVVRYAKRKKK